MLKRSKKFKLVKKLRPKLVKKRKIQKIQRLQKTKKLQKQRKPKEIKKIEFDHGFIRKIAGEEAIKIVEFLGIKKNVSEFVLAEKLNLTINQIRNILYKLQNNNLVSSTRKKDKIKGWYIYYWTFNFPILGELAFNIKRQKLMQLKNQLSDSAVSQLYICKNKCILLKFKESLEYEFRCPECDLLLEEKDSKKELEEIKKEVEILEKELKQ